MLWLLRHTVVDERCVVKPRNLIATILHLAFHVRFRVSCLQRVFRLQLTSISLLVDSKCGNIFHGRCVLW